MYRVIEEQEAFILLDLAGCIRPEPTGQAWLDLSVPLDWVNLPPIRTLSTATRAEAIEFARSNNRFAHVYLGHTGTTLQAQLLCGLARVIAARMRQDPRIRAVMTFVDFFTILDLRDAARHHEKAEALVTPTADIREA
ncbi:hypothetical protein [Pandoraea communis]|uniref:hypothetical protein n=1 Tax=Pandoraea communis TaxID=2508297 RepID=UPI0025A666C2|nr:hypothetical protein [Pandoraea communis]MDM8356587.1 hypothetical protein [Pandoraea communis]